MRHAISRLTGPALFGLALLLGTTSSATAQPATALLAERWEPLHAQNLNMLAVHGAETLGHLNFAVSLMLSYEDDPLTVVNAANANLVVNRIVGGQFRGDLGAALGVLDFLEFSLNLPIVFYQFGDSMDYIGLPGQEIDGAALGDFHIAAKGTILNPKDFYGIGLAAVLPLYFPTGDQDSFNSDGYVRFHPKLVLDWRHEIGVKLALNFGYHVRARKTFRNMVSDDAFTIDIAAEAPLGWEPLRLVANLKTAVQWDSELKTTNDIRDLKPVDGVLQNAYVEADLALRYTPIPEVQVVLGGGAGLTPVIGAPDYRLFLGVGYAPPRASDIDDDGVPDDEDACPNDPEDQDDFQDTDGCPDLDNDGDRIPDAVDGCPDEAEDADGFQDEDGCPDADNDQDGIADVNDQCPNDPEGAADGFQDDDGCPDTDNDGDGIADGDDQCPNEAEDLDAFEDADGCPDDDNDQDGVPDVSDLCPTQPENINGIEDEDGCPDSADQKVKVTTGKIQILDKVYFATGKDTIKRRSFKLLDEVAQVLNDNPHLTLVRVEGHTDDQGEEADNQSLSQRRAEAVSEYLVNKGVAAERLRTEGYGESRPVDTNTTSKGRAANRRVEFVVLELNGASAEE